MRATRAGAAGTSTGGWGRSSPWVPDGVGEFIQVKYLANPLGSWPNEHTVRSISDVAWYALVVYEALDVTGVLAFPPDLAEICRARRKRHPGQSTSLQFSG